MAEVAFDTIAEVRRLKDVGFAQDQAEAITRSIHAGVTGGVATKADLERLGGEVRAVEAGLRTDMERLGGEVRTEIANVRTEIADLRTELRGEIADVRSELRTEIVGLGAELRGEIANVDGNLRTEIAGVRSELRGEIADLRKRMDSVRGDLLWIKLIGGAVLAAVVLPWMTEVAAPMFGN